MLIAQRVRIKPAVSDAMVCQMDLLASLSTLVNLPLKEKFDSQNILPAFMGESNKGRTELVVEANGKMAFRYKNWAMIPPYKGNVRNETGNEVGNLPEFGLFNLKEDIGQTENLASKDKFQLEKMKSRFFEITKGYYQPKVPEIELK